MCAYKKGALNNPSLQYVKHLEGRVAELERLQSAAIMPERVES